MLLYEKDFECSIKLTTVNGFMKTEVDTLNIKNNKY